MKQLYILLIFFSINCFSQNEFITIWNSKIHPPYKSIYLPILQNDSPINYSWQKINDDLTQLEPFSDEFVIPSNNGPITIDFPEEGLYRIKISTNSTNFRFGYPSPNSLAEELFFIEQWGNIKWGNFSKAFSGCGMMDVIATDSPNLNNATNVSYMFGDCYSLVFNSSINLWDTSQITDFEGMFSNAFNFNQPLHSWNTSNAISLKLMFMGANSFNQNIDDWIVDNVIDFFGLFHYNSSFNQPLNKWNLHNAETTSHMFCGTQVFNQNLNRWDVSNVDDMSWMFNGANKFNQDLSSWKLNSIEKGYKFFDHSGMNCSNFSNTLTGWSTNPNLANNVDHFGVAEMKHNQELIPILDWFTSIKNWNLEGNMHLYQNCNSLSMEDFKKHAFKVYPNPANDVFTIDGIEATEVDIYDSKGALIQKSLNSNIIYINNLNPGIYIIIINKKYQHKLIKK